MPRLLPPFLLTVLFSVGHSLMFRSMDELFTTRTVARSGPVWRLPRNDQPLDFTYHWQGESRSVEDFIDSTYANALLVMKDGHLASLDTPIDEYLPELRGGGYAGVSIREVLQMRSGVDYEERYDFANPGVAASNHIAALVRNTARFADAARTLDRIHEPGAWFQYKTIDTAVLGWPIERVTGTSVAAYTESCLWEPLGQMMLDGGVADGRRIVSEAWVRESTRPSSGSDAQPGGYGYQWWMTGDSGAYAAIGLQGQYVYIDPATRTIVVKLSYYPPGDNTADGETAAFLAASSAWDPL